MIFNFYRYLKLTLNPISSLANNTTNNKIVRHNDHIFFRFVSDVTIIFMTVLEQIYLPLIVIMIQTPIFAILPI